jgi:hypothetical protein
LTRPRRSPVAVSKNGLPRAAQSSSGTILWVDLS